MIKTIFTSKIQVEQYIDLAIELFDSSVYSQSLTKNVDELKTLLQLCKNGNNKYFIGFYEEDNSVVGIMAGQVHKRPFMKELIASDLFIYVSAKYRGKSKAGKELLKCFESEAKFRGAEVLFVAANTGINTEKTKLFFESNSYTEYGTNYMKEV